MINFYDVSKSYGKTIAISDMSIDIGSPGIYCLLGRNGAGKTTMLRLIAGHIAASKGRILVNGKQTGTLNMPEDVNFIANGTSHFNMKIDLLFKAAHDLSEGFDYQMAVELASKFQLSLDKKYKQLSLGMKTMVNTILGMASNEEILILDEPVLGFDAIMRKNFYNLLYESYQSKPKTIIISTHLIDEIAGIAEKLIVIDKGRLILISDINEISEKAYCVTGPAADVERATEHLNVLSTVSAGGFISKTVYDTRIEGTEAYSVSNTSLQDFFIALVGTEEDLRQ